ncbi:MAG: aldo/keto reductase [Candidatus Kariarchaeaceae archaeon]|jgi:aryl-alcohol dehydrogenase-like predicted oxidoreductase
MLSRILGRSGLNVSAVGLGCWAIGGPVSYIANGDRRPLSFGSVNNEESIRAIQRACELGINFFDTADAYGCGDSETILGQGIQDFRDDIIIATKFANVIDKETRTWLGHPDPPISQDYIRDCCIASLKRLNTDYIDLYQFHWKEYDPELAVDLLPMLENLIDEGLIRSYGWSTPFIDQVKVFAKGVNCTAIQYNYNIFERHPEMLKLCQDNNLASIARGPYAMGLLTGKYSQNTILPDNDMRHYWWNLTDGTQAKQLEYFETIKEILTDDGRTLAQAALGWLLALDKQIIPIPGFKNVKQVEETAKILELGPLSNKQMNEIEQILAPIVNELLKLD